MSIIENMITIMKSKGIKAKRIAEKLEVKESVISTWKSRNTDPPSKYLLQICEVLDISIYELLGADEEGLNQEERKLIEYFRSCSVGNKAIILNAAEGLSSKELQDTQDQETKSSDLKIG